MKPSIHLGILTFLDFCPTTFLFVCCLAACCPAQSKPTPDFNKDVRPIFNEHCVACHGGVKQAGELSFVYPEQVLELIEPGEAETSYLIERIETDDPDDRMPPAEHGRALNNDEIGKLRAWIDAGGQWGKHWAFEPPAAVDPPVDPADDWSVGRLDRFILASLNAAGLQPAKPASPERWLRRACLDLTGLPPTLEQLDTFQDDYRSDSDQAYDRAVTRMLASPAFGERWASVWMDAVRYADSKGLGQDGKRNMWQYRDWIIRALNNDLPYDQFTIRQLAGDLLPNPTMDDLIATACHRLTQTNEEGGTDDEQFRIEAVIDRINTTWQAWQGLSFGCVQCHAHPYDPISHDEYYRFMAFFNNTVDCDLSSDEPMLAVPLNQSEFTVARQLDQEIARLQENAWANSVHLLNDPSLWHHLDEFEVSTNNTTQVTTQRINDRTEYQTVGTVAKQTTVAVVAHPPEPLDAITAFRFTGLPQDLELAEKDSEWGFVLSHVSAEVVDSLGETVAGVSISKVIADGATPLLDPQKSLDAKDNNGVGAYSRLNYPRSAAFVFSAPVTIKSSQTLRISIAQNIFELGAFPLVAHRVQLDLSDDAHFQAWLNDPAQIDNRELLAQLQEKRRAIKAVKLPVMRQRSRQWPRKTFVFDRGNFLDKSEEVAADTPRFMPAIDWTNSPNRLDLAKWIASDRNPLTARVAVNRVWGQLFGTGIVETQEDFGSSGSAPSHPQLLDDLAARFQAEMHWSLKTLLRELVLSSTYRQSSHATESKLQIDPNNRLLSRGPSGRLPAETIRDQALAIAGLLNSTQYGAPVYPPLPEGVWNPFQAGDKWKTAAVGDANRYRRTIYTYTKRTIPFPLMASFDAPARDFCAMRRLPSNTPLQALMMLNDAAFVEASKSLAIRMQDAAPGLSKQLQFGWKLATCRKPTMEELSELTSLYESESANGESGLVAIASVLLNLNEVLTK